MKKILIIFILFFNINVFGYDKKGIKNVCGYWLDYVPIKLYYLITIDLIIDPNDVINWIENCYYTQQSPHHIGGGYGISFKDPNDRTNLVIFHRFDWKKENDEIVGDKIKFSFWIDPTSDPNDNVTWMKKDYYLSLIEGNKRIIFKDPENKNVNIIFYYIKWEIVNLNTYAIATKNN